MAQIIPTDKASLPKKNATGAGKGLTWHDGENLALARGAASACSDPLVGSGMTITQLARKIRAAFITDKERPQNACSLGKYGGPLDERRWDGRSPEACRK